MKTRLNFGMLVGLALLLIAVNSIATTLEFESDINTELVGNYEWNTNLEGFDSYPPKVVGPTVPAIWNYYPGATVLDPVLTEPAPVPEPATMLLFGMGLVGIGVGLRRKK